MAGCALLCGLGQHRRHNDDSTSTDGTHRIAPDDDNRCPLLRLRLLRAEAASGHRHHRQNATLVQPAGVLLINSVSTYTALGSIAVVGLLAFVFTLPLTYTNMRYILNDGIGYWSNLFSHYGKGMRRWGFIFLVVFMATLIGCVCYLFTSFPAIILSIAGNEANKGFLYGDPYGLPSYIGWLSALVFLLIGFIQAYVMLSFLFPVY